MSKFISSIFVSLAFSLMAVDPSNSYLKDLEEYGYCVIPHVISSSDTKVLYERVWHEFIEKAWPECKMDDRSNWRETFPIHNYAAVFTGPACHIQVMWDIRQDPHIIDIFAKIWNTHDLIVSMDGLSLMCPSDIRPGSIRPWPHVDQGGDNIPPPGFESESCLCTKPYTIQGQLLLEDSFEGDAGFYCIPKSHLLFDELSQGLELLNREITSKDERGKARDAYLNEFFKERKDDDDQLYVRKHITAPRGSLILWDSRTIHWNQHANPNGPSTSRVRMVSYLSYVPKSRMTDEGSSLRKITFEKRLSTGHNPLYPLFRDTPDILQPEYAHYLEDPSYVNPSLQLTSLGSSLLGFQSTEAKL